MRGGEKSYGIVKLVSTWWGWSETMAAKGDVRSPHREYGKG